MRLRRLLKAVFDSPFAYRLGRWGLAILFFWSGAAKVPDMQGFADLISDYGIVFEESVYITAVALVALEILAGLGLAFDVRGSLASVSGLLLLFSAVLTYGMSLGLDIECGCFGLGGHDRAAGTLAGALGRNLVLLALCGYLYVFRFRSRLRPRAFPGFTRPVRMERGVRGS